MAAAVPSTFCWDTLSPRFRVILCDLWGVVHDGVRVNRGAAARLERWRGEGRSVLLITNAPRTADAVERQLACIGLPRQCWDVVVTGGETGIEALRALKRPVGFLGTDEDRSILESRGIQISHAEDVPDIACAGLQAQRPRLEQYARQLQRWAARDARLHCLNPDRMVMRDGAPELCAGALADLYEEFGGRVEWYGKPHRAIYERALRLAGQPRVDAVLAVGDSLSTDMLGAARMGFDAVFVSGGIHAGEPFPEDFSRSNHLGDWRPIAIVEGLA